MSDEEGLVGGIEAMSDLDELVSPFYLLLLHANIERESPDGQRRFISEARSAKRRVTEDAITRLLSIGLSWRTAMMGSWWAAVTDTRGAIPRIGALLEASLTTYAGQMHAFALSSFGDQEAVGYLCSYLHRYLPRRDLRYDQSWAYAALRDHDRRTGSRHAADFDDAWRAWAGSDQQRLIEQVDDAIAALRSITESIAAPNSSAF